MMKPFRRRVGRERSGAKFGMIDWRQALDNHLDGIAGNLIAIRRRLHAHPEPSREEFETTRFLGSQLLEAGLAHSIVLEGRGILAGPSLSPDGLAVALRADM